MIAAREAEKNRINEVLCNKKFVQRFLMDKIRDDRLVYIRSFHENTLFRILVFC